MCMWIKVLFYSSFFKLQCKGSWFQTHFHVLHCFFFFLNEQYFQGISVKFGAYFIYSIAYRISSVKMDYFSSKTMPKI